MTDRSELWYLDRLRAELQRARQRPRTGRERRSVLVVGCDCHRERRWPSSPSPRWSLLW